MMTRVLLSSSSITLLDLTEHTFPSYLIKRYICIKLKHVDLKNLLDYLQYKVVVNKIVRRRMI
jgi:hypothetical protein